MVVEGTYNFSEPLVDWTWYIVAEDGDRPMTYHRLEDLVPDSFYELQVIAVNQLGRSDVDSQFIFSTATAQRLCPDFSVLFYFIISCCIFHFSALTLLVGGHEGHLACKKFGVGLLVMI